MTDTNPPADRIAEIRARLDAATEGPWVYESAADIHGVEDGRIHYVTPQFAARDDDPPMTSFYDRADAELVANAPTDLAYLLARVEELEGQLAKAQAELDDQRGATRVAAGAADRFRDVLSEFLGHGEENPGDDVLVAELREKGGFSGPEPTRWRDFLAGARAQIDRIEAERSVVVIGPDTLCPCGKVNDGSGSGYCSYEHFEEYDGEACR
jgi:hypothetical protein